MTNKKRAAALFAAVAFVFVMLFSMVYIAEESNHDCIGSDCQICYQISVCQHTLRSVLLIACPVLFAAALLCVLCGGISNTFGSSIFCTLVSLKVKLSD